MKRFGRLAVSAIFMTTVAAAEPRSGSFRIELSDGSHVIALDAPVRRGTVVTFHEASGGALTGVPAEMVVRIVSDAVEPATMTVRAPRLRGGPLDRTTSPGEGGSLEPGEVVVIGPTGDGIAPPPASLAPESANAVPPVVPGLGVGAYGGAPDPNVVNPNGVLVGTDGLPRVASSTDLSRALAAQPVVGSNGFPTTGTGAPTVIGPNGTPTLAPGVPGSAAPVIGPNGTPIFSTGTTPTVIGPNGTPILAPGSARPGTAQPVIGPNGTPVLAQPGQPGSAQPVIGPNGTPVFAPQGQPGSAQPAQPGSAQPVIGPNGTPVIAPQGQPGGPAPGASPGSASPGSGS